jgi:hypothetical protein
MKRPILGFALVAAVVAAVAAWRGGAAGRRQAAAERVKVDSERRDEKVRHNASKAGRPVFPYSVVPGGVEDSDEAADWTARDSVVAAHYSDVRIAKLRREPVLADRMVHVSYRSGNQVYWTSKKVRLRTGEAILTDGKEELRARCGNRISETARTPVNVSSEPPEGVLDTPQLFALNLDIGHQALPSWRAGETTVGAPLAINTATGKAAGNGTDAGGTGTSGLGSSGIFNPGGSGGGFVGFGGGGAGGSAGGGATGGGATGGGAAGGGAPGGGGGGGSTPGGETGSGGPGGGSGSGGPGGSGSGSGGGGSSSGGGGENPGGESSTTPGGGGTPGGGTGPGTTGSGGNPGSPLLPPPPDTITGSNTPSGSGPSRPGGSNPGGGVDLTTITRQVDNQVPQPTPEPATYLMVGGALALLGLYRRSAKR